MGHYTRIEHTGRHGHIAELLSDELILETGEDAAQLAGELYFGGYAGVVLHEKNLPPPFFDLKTGLAGEMLQKFSNFRLPLAILCDGDALPGNSLRDFIRECNRGRQVLFVNSLSKALELLSAV